MADTANKRRSVQAMTVGLALPVPDGATSAGDRAMLMWLYALGADDQDVVDVVYAGQLVRSTTNARSHPQSRIIQRG